MSFIDSIKKLFKVEDTPVVEVVPSFAPKIDESEIVKSATTKLVSNGRPCGAQEILNTPGIMNKVFDMSVDEAITYVSEILDKTIITGANYAEVEVHIKDGFNLKAVKTATKTSITVDHIKEGSV